MFTDEQDWMLDHYFSYLDALETNAKSALRDFEEVRECIPEFKDCEDTLKAIRDLSEYVSDEYHKMYWRRQ